MAVSNVVPITPPSLDNVEAEARLLSAIFTDADAMTACAVVDPSDFHLAVHGRIFEALRAIHADGKPVSPVMLKAEFEHDEALKALGGLPYLARLSGVMPGVLDAASLADQIHDLAIRRRMREQALAAADACLDMSASLSDIAGLAELEEQGARRENTFPLMSIADIKAMPPAQWLIHEIVGEEGLSVFYGPPGEGKTFVVIDMALRLASGIDWHGYKAKRVGVIYIAGEGVRGLSKRVKGWELQNGLSLEHSSFALIPEAVQMLEQGEVAKLKRTIDQAAASLQFDVGLVVIDTVSRSIAGVDENAQETMSAFVRSCDAIRDHIGGAVIGIHHTGKDKEKGMRGSTVLNGGCDTACLVTKDGETVKLDFTKQKDAEEPEDIFMNLRQVEWGEGEERLTTLVPIRGDKPTENLPHRSQIAQAFGVLADAWSAGRPLSPKTQTRAEGRYAPRVLAAQLGGEADAWATLITSWLENGNVAYELYDKRAKKYGLQVLDAIA